MELFFILWFSLYTIFAIICGIFGYKLCKKGNIWGVLLWLFALGIIGVIIGLNMISRYRQRELMTNSKYNMSKQNEQEDDSDDEEINY